MKRTTLAAGLLCVGLGMYLSSGSDPAPNPFVPDPKPSRPFLQLVVRLAKNLLWLALVAEPDQPEDVQMVHARCDENGDVLLNHGQGW